MIVPVCGSDSVAVSCLEKSFDDFVGIQVPRRRLSELWPVVGVRLSSGESVSEQLARPVIKDFGEFVSRFMFVAERR